MKVLAVFAHPDSRSYCHGVGLLSPNDIKTRLRAFFSTTDRPSVTQYDEQSRRSSALVRRPSTALHSSLLHLLRWSSAREGGPSDDNQADAGGERDEVNEVVLQPAVVFDLWNQIRSSNIEKVSGCER